MLDIAVDLLWLRPKKVGGTEFFIRNLLDGFLLLEEPFRLRLLVSADNRESFAHYTADERIELLETDVVSANISGRILWNFFCQNRFLRKRGIRNCFVPVYCRPLFNGGVSYVNVIHDLQAAHYPQYHPFHEIAYSRLCWWLDTHRSKRLAAISEWVRQDILDRYRVSPDRITTIYNPITVEPGDVVAFESLSDRYGILKNEYYYTISQLIPHKNLDTLIEVMYRISKGETGLPEKLLISGVGGKDREKLLAQIRDRGLYEKVILTGFVENGERNTLYRYSRAFLFPSVFEGFGMPPVEAMLFGAVVITTDRTCIPEVTQGKANYVKDPYDAQEWIRVMQSPENRAAQMDFGAYDQRKLTKRYYDFLSEAFPDSRIEENRGER